jgi:Reverse transcriptase (RNA-dependent DNA polymerase)
LFIFRSDKTIIYLLVYVDDIILTGNDSSAINALLKELQSHFSIKYLGKLHYFLGIEVTQAGNDLFLTQSRYLHTILSKANMLSAKSCTTPMQSGLQLSKTDGQVLSDPHQYRLIVGALQYATITRPDLTFSVNKAAQFVAQPNDVHWQLVKRILRYINGTLSHGLQLRPSSQLNLNAYSDAD